MVASVALIAPVSVGSATDVVVDVVASGAGAPRHGEPGARAGDAGAGWPGDPGGGAREAGGRRGRRVRYGCCGVCLQTNKKM